MEERIPTFCTLCPFHCAAIATVEGGRLVKWEADKESGLHYAPCRSFKGVGNIEIGHHPDRLKYPLKRAGIRGEGKWERISWDQALDEISQKLLELKEKYGPECLGAGVNSITW
ncbi:molybdopterin-dependent oxidoreductase [Chloroflexota bacterium]